MFVEYYTQVRNGLVVYNPLCFENRLLIFGDAEALLKKKKAIKPHDRLVLVRCTDCSAYTPNLSTRWSSWGLEGPCGPGNRILGGAWHLDAFSAYLFRTWLRNDAPDGTIATPEV